MDNKKKLVFLTPQDAKYGFGLAGAIHYEISVDELELTLDKLVTDEDIGIIVVDERLIKKIADDRIKELEEKFSGVFLILPSPEKPVSEREEYISKLMEKAIGYYVRLT